MAILIPVAFAAVASGLTTAWHNLLAHRHAKSQRSERCEHRWVYHSLYNEGRFWNRVCGWCRKHETHWRDTPHPNWPPPGARLDRRQRVPPDEEWRKRREAMKRG